MEDSEQPISLIRAAHLACVSVTASSSEASVASKVERGLSVVRLGNGENPKLPALLPLLSFGEKILSIPSLPAIHQFIKFQASSRKLELAETTKDISPAQTYIHTRSK